MSQKRPAHQALRRLRVWERPSAPRPSPASKARTHLSKRSAGSSSRVPGHLSGTDSCPRRGSQCSCKDAKPSSCSSGQGLTPRRPGPPASRRWGPGEAAFLVSPFSGAGRASPAPGPALSPRCSVLPSRVPPRRQRVCLPHSLTGTLRITPGPPGRLGVISPSPERLQLVTSAESPLPPRWHTRGFWG